MSNILLIEDNEAIIMGLESLFTNNGYNVRVARSAYQAKEILDNAKETEKYRTLIGAGDVWNIDIVILDVMLPDGDGFSLCRKIKADDIAPVIFLTAKDEEKDVVMGLELGADDYVIKPFSPKELEARVKAVLRRTISKDVIIPSSSSSASGSAAGAKGGKNIITTGAIKIDTARRQVYRKNERIRLTGMEFSLLELLVNNSGQAYSRNEILQHVWSYPADHRIDTRVVDVHISRLRSKLEADPTNPELILTARGIGYMFQRIN